MAALKSTQIKALVLKVGSRSDEEMRVVPLIHKSKSFETPRLALIDLAKSIEEENSDMLVADEPEYQDCCKPYIKQHKKYCADCSNYIEGIKFKNNEVEIIKEVDSYEMENWINEITDQFSCYVVGDWQIDYQLRHLTELSNINVVVVFDLQEVLTILLENDPKKVDKLFAGNSRVVEMSNEESDENDTDDGEE